MSIERLLICTLPILLCCSAFAQSKDSLRTVSLDSAMVTTTTGRTLRGNEFKISPIQVQHSIAFLGEPDIIRYIGSLPGVGAGMEGSMALFVRGANNGSNRIEYDGVPVGNSSHLFGFSSAIASDMASETVFCPGGISARYGDLSSSIISIARNSALDLAPKGKLSISPFFQSIYAAMPLAPGKFGIQVSARTSPIPQAGKLFLKKYDTGFGSSMDGFVYDFNVSADIRTGRNSRLDMMYYTSSDNFNYSENTFANNTSWGTDAVKAGWTFKPSPRTEVFAKTYYMTAESSQRQGDIYSHAYKNTSIELDNVTRQFLSSAGARTYLLENLSLEGGIEYTHFWYSPAGNRYEDRLFSGYLEMGYSIPDRLSVTGGVRGSRKLDWRFLADVYLYKSFGVELAADRMTQYHHIIEGLPTGWSLDLSVPASDMFPEETTRQVYTGLFHNGSTGKRSWSASAGAYLRKMQGLVCLKTGTNLMKLSDMTWTEETDTGEGKSAGIETALTYKSPFADATLSYTLSKTTRRFSKINNGNEFPYKFDRRHILSFQGRVHLKNHSLMAAASYASGHRETLPVSVYQGVAPPLWGTNNTMQYTVEFGQNIRFRQEMSGINEFKLKDYFRIDVGYTYDHHGTKCNNSFNFSVYNVLNRHNPYLLFVKDGQWKQLSILPIMPSVRWTIEF